MARYRLLLRCIGEAVIADGLKCLAGLVPFGERLYDIACDAYKRYKDSCRKEEALAQVEAVAQAPVNEIKAEAREVVSEIQAKASPEVAAQLADPAIQKALVGYLEHVPSAVRSSLRRPADPSGRSVPKGFSVQKPDDFLRLLPPRPPRFQPGDRTVGNWQLEDLLGVGGFGEVWKARNPDLHNLPPVALKFCMEESAARYLRHEATLIDQMMGHSQRLQGIVQLRNAYLNSDPPCLEYELIEGGDLCGLLSHWQAMNPSKRADQATRLIQRLATILTPLHRLNPPIVHRDLKPANILVRRKDSGKFEVKIGDFGLGGIAARQALAGSSRGFSRGDLLSQSLRGSHTPLYASPEQIRGDPPDPRDDVHALGVMWFQILVGDFGRGIGVDFDEEIKGLGLSDDVIPLVKQCVVRAERRWPDAGILAEEIGQLIGADQERREAAEEAERKRAEEVRQQLEQEAQRRQQEEQKHRLEEMRQRLAEEQRRWEVDGRRTEQDRERRQRETEAKRFHQEQEAAARWSVGTSGRPLIRCPHCGKEYKLWQNFIGKVIKCVSCGQRFTGVDSEGAYQKPAAEEEEEKRPSRGRPQAGGVEEEEEARGESRLGDLKPHRGVLILVLGILALPTLCGIILGPIAWVMAINDLKEIREGRMDPKGEGLTTGGWICGMLGTIIAVACCVICGILLIIAQR